MIMNKDWEQIYNSLINNWITPFLWNSEWFDEILNYDFLEYEHLWPDLIFISEKNIYWIEHFYVDSSETKKWSKLMIEHNKYIDGGIVRDMEKELEKNKIPSRSYKYKSTLKYENLKNNTYSNFEKHYKKINLYNSNIIDKYWDNKNIEIIFYIEYNILPSMYIINWKPEKKIYPFNDVNFLNYFNSKKNIKWIIFCVDRKNYYLPIQDKYIVDNINIFEFSDWKIEDFEMNSAMVWLKIEKY